MIGLRKRFDILTQKEQIVWEVLGFCAALLGGHLTRHGIKNGWRLLRHEEPPQNPARGDVGWRDALILGVVTGALAGLMRILSRRLAAEGWRRWRGKRPPF
jgi:hypothetical protein